MFCTKNVSIVRLRCSIRRGGVRGFGWPPFFVKTNDGWLTFPLWKLQSCPYCGTPTRYLGHDSYAHARMNAGETRYFCPHCKKTLVCNEKTLAFLCEKHPHLTLCLVERRRLNFRRKALFFRSSSHGITGQLREYANSYEEADFGARRKRNLKSCLNFGWDSHSRSHHSWKETRKTQWRRLRQM